MEVMDSEVIEALMGTISIHHLIKFPEKMKILTHHPDFVYDLNEQHESEETSPTKGTALKLAVTQGDIPLLKHLLNNPDIDANLLEIFDVFDDDNKISAFMWVCGHGNVEMVQLFLQHPKLNVNLESINDHYMGYTTTALNEALMNSHFHIAEMLLKHPNTDVNFYFSSESTNVLFKCVYSNHIEGVELLLQHPKIDVNQTSNLHMKGRTPLFLACQRGNIQITKLLLEKEADPTIPMKFGRSMSSAGLTRIEKTHDLLEYMIWLRDLDKKNWTTNKGWYREGSVNYPEIISMLKDKPAASAT